MTVQKIEKVIKGCKTEKQIKEALKRANIKYTLDRYANDFDAKITNGKSVIRIYKSYKGGFVVQSMRWVKMNYSGVPTFFATDSVF